VSTNDDRLAVRADQDGPTPEDWGQKGTPSERAKLAHTIREGSAWGAPSTVHAAAQRLLWEGLAAADVRIVDLAIQAGANPHEPNWTVLDSGPSDWDTPLSWLFCNQPTHCPNPIAYRRDLFDLLWQAGGATDPRPDDCCSGIAMAWIHRADLLGADEVAHIGRALLNATPTPSAGSTPEPADGWGLLTARNENGWTPLDQALVEGCGVVLEFIEKVCKERGRPLSDLMNRSTAFRAPIPSVVAFCYGLHGQTQQFKRLERADTAGTFVSQAHKKKKTLRRAIETLERIGAQAIAACPWDRWRSVLPDRTSPLTTLLSTLGTGAGLKILRQQPGFDWNDPMIMDPVAVAALNRWRRGILGIHHERMRDQGHPPYGWRRRDTGASAEDNPVGAHGSWLRSHPAMASFQPILERNVRQTVQDFALDTHRLAKSSNPADQAKIERARLTIFEQSVPGPEKRAPSRTRRSI
jgi:hypothetical protein